MRDLSPKQQKFINLYLDSDKPTYGNGTLAYIEAYGIKDRDSAGVMASNLLRNIKIKEQIIKNNRGFEINLDKHLLTLDRKLDYLATKPNPTKEEIASIRLLAEIKGAIGARTALAIQFNIKEGQQCPTCKQEYAPSLSPAMPKEELDERLFNIILRRFTPEELIREVEKRREGGKVDYI